MPLLSPSQNKTQSRAGSVETSAGESLGWIDRYCRKQVLKRLAHLQSGSIAFYEEETPLELGLPLSSSDLGADLYVRNPRFFRRIVTGGTIGAAEAYIDGDWAADDLPFLLQIFAGDLKTSSELDSQWRYLKRPAEIIWTWLRRNTPTGSRKNIAAHYDLSNEFYRLWLDETMAYSGGVFPSKNATLAEASRNKFDLICQKLDLQPGDRLLEIGTGWGGFAVYAAENYGAIVTTTTISQQQREYSQQLFENRGLRERITLLDRDYRSLEGNYDKLASIEMIEAVGHEYLPSYFAKCDSLLRPGGRMALQAITIPEQRYDRYRQSVDFIQRYIFPGGALPSVEAIQQAVGKNSVLRLIGMQDYCSHYARTLKLWRERFFDNLTEVRQLGFNERFIRSWDYYLSYCIAGFREQQVGLAHLLYEK